jgi:phosphatidylserine decarboxylase
MSTPSSSASVRIPTRPDDPAPPVAREGWIIVFVFALIAMIATLAAGWFHPLLGAIVGLVGLVLTVWCVWFFRDPQRAIPDAPGVVVSGADGVVMRVEACVPPEELGMDAQSAAGMQRVVVFLNVFNVHVNRAPLGGTVVKVAHRSGGFFHAGKPDAEKNERRSMWIRLPDGRSIAIAQITGLIARRIINRVRDGETLRTGERFGLIRFGSRTDVYLPTSFRVQVKPGDKVQGGSTVLAIDETSARQAR